MADLGTTVRIEASFLSPANGKEGAPSTDYGENPSLAPPMNYPQDLLSDREATFLFPGSVKDTLDTATRIIYYMMRGYYVTGAVYESWVAINIPNNTPPSGHTLTNITVVSYWIA